MWVEFCSCVSSAIVVYLGDHACVCRGAFIGLRQSAQGFVNFPSRIASGIVKVGYLRALSIPSGSRPIAALRAAPCPFFDLSVPLEMSVPICVRCAMSSRLRSLARWGRVLITISAGIPLPMLGKPVYWWGQTLAADGKWPAVGPAHGRTPLSWSCDVLAQSRTTG